MESIWNSFYDPITRSAARRSPKVVSVPVRFVSSQQRRSDAAERIQAAVRGLLVRKSVRRIAAAKREVDEIEAAISRPETAEAIRREPRERLRLNETLMRSLLKLDAVRGVDSGVRDCRKAVIKKAIALQERIDSITTATAENLELESEVTEAESVEVENEEKHDSLEKKENEDLDSEESKGDSETSSGSESESESPVSEKEGARPEKMAVDKIMEENERLMGMVAELCERSAAQSRLLSSLSDRVGLLERAYVCDKQRRKKKKQRRGCDSNVYKHCGNRL